MTTTEFGGFPGAGLMFLQRLANNNNKEWFDTNRQDYEEHLLVPALSFIKIMGQKLQTISKGIRFDTRTNGAGTLMRIARDIRFSKDKSPYKTAIAGMFWEGAAKKTQCPAFGFHLESDSMRLMAGMFRFQKPQLEQYRRAIDNPGLGQELETTIESVKSDGYSIHGEHFKRVPKPYTNDHKRADLLRYNGLYAAHENIKPQIISTPRIIEVCFEHFTKMSPIQRWLSNALL